MPALSQLLAFLVNYHLDGKELRDSIVTKECFGKEPQQYVKGQVVEQAIARTHCHNLRKRLSEYYALGGLDDLLLIEIPKGAFYPDFSYNPRSPANKHVRLGLAQLNREAPANIRRAIEHFEEAIRLEPKLAPAYAGKASALTTRTLHTFNASPRQMFPQAEVAGLKALEFDPRSWRAHAALAGVYAFRQQWKLADEQIREALQSNPLETRDHGVYGPYLLGRGRYKEAAELAKFYQEEYMTDSVFLRRSALYLYVLRQYEEAELILVNIMQDEQIWYVHLLLAFVYLATDSSEKALHHMRHIELMTGLDLWPGLHTLCLARVGKIDEARQHFSDFSNAKENYIQPLHLALGSMALGDHLKAIKWLSIGADDGDPFMLWLHLYPLVDPLRSYREFQELIQRLGLPAPPGFFIVLKDRSRPFASALEKPLSTLRSA